MDGLADGVKATGAWSVDRAPARVEQRVTGHRIGDDVSTVFVVPDLASDREPDRAPTSCPDREACRAKRAPGRVGVVQEQNALALDGASVVAHSKQVASRSVAARVGGPGRLVPAGWLVPHDRSPGPDRAREPVGGRGPSRAAILRYIFRP